MGVSVGVGVTVSVLVGVFVCVAVGVDVGGWGVDVDVGGTGLGVIVGGAIVVVGSAVMAVEFRDSSSATSEFVPEQEAVNRISASRMIIKSVWRENI